MNSTIFFFIFVPILSLILLSINFILAAHKPYKEKKTPFECGYHSFLSQNRTQFTISFFIFALLFLIFDLEIVLIYPVTVSSYFNTIYGIIVVILFVLILTLGFVFELGKRALTIYTVQTFKVLYSMLPMFLLKSYCIKLLKKYYVISLIIGIIMSMIILIYTIADFMNILYTNNIHHEILEWALDFIEINLVDDYTIDVIPQTKLNYMVSPMDNNTTENLHIHTMTGGQNTGSGGDNNTTSQEGESSTAGQGNQPNTGDQGSQPNTNDQESQSNVNTQESTTEAGESSKKRKWTDFSADLAAARAQSEIAQHNLMENITNAWKSMDKKGEDMSKEELKSFDDQLQRIIGEHTQSRIKQMSDYTKFLKSEEEDDK